MSTDTLEANEYRPYMLHIKAGMSHKQALAAVRRSARGSVRAIMRVDARGRAV